MRHASAAVALVFTVAAVGCSGQRPPAPRLFPGTTAWKVALPGPLRPPLATDGARIFVALRDGGVRAIDTASGALVWAAAEVSGSIVATQQAVLVRNADGTLWRLDSVNGNERWRVETMPGELPPVLLGDSVLVAGRGIVAVDLRSARRLWSSGSDSEAITPPVSDGEIAVVAEASGALRCLSTRTGETLWTRQFARPLLAAPALDDERVYVGTLERGFVALSRKDGREQWRWTLGADVREHPILLEKTVVFVSHENVLYALGRGNGHLIWRAAFPTRPFAPPVAIGAALVVASRDGSLYSFTASNGNGIGKQATSAELAAPPIAVGGRLFVGLRDRSIEAIDTLFGSEVDADVRAGSIILCIIEFFITRWRTRNE